ncbi:hypothetical protein SKAU_G00259130 [Synaphobranchus kaupii]|uniref:Uncharacterized protein n=1 Tax=Synaphobranchus kaupii TaxID=118154 RepID=A0A9Q1ISD1_SYNKA|nr:hypothetical protein SKAU_G00259130 [Synaphobranchus kaupii]
MEVGGGVCSLTGSTDDTKLQDAPQALQVAEATAEMFRGVVMEGLLSQGSPAGKYALRGGAEGAYQVGRVRPGARSRGRSRPRGTRRLHPLVKWLRLETQTHASAIELLEGSAAGASDHGQRSAFLELRRAFKINQTLALTL